MQAVPPNLRSFLSSNVKKSERGYCIGHDALNEFWTTLCTQSNVSGWRRFSRFCQSTARHFEIVSDPDTAPSEDEVLYLAGVVVMVLFDLLGIRVQPSELEDFLQSTVSSDHDSMSDSEMMPFTDPTADHSSCSSSLEITDKGSEDCRMVSGGDMLETPEPMNRQKKTEMQRVLRNNVGTTSNISVEGAQGELDVKSLLKLLKSKELEIAKLRSQKRQLQQGLRRAHDKIAKQQENWTKEVEVLRSRRDFDIERRDSTWVDSEKKWSWITPLGQANVAATCSEHHPFLCYKFCSYVCIFLWGGQHFGSLFE